MKNHTFMGSYFGFMLLSVLAAQQLNTLFPLLGSGALTATAVMVLWRAFSQSNRMLMYRRTGLALVLLGFIGVLHAPISGLFALAAMALIISGIILLAFCRDLPSPVRSPR